MKKNKMPSFENLVYYLVNIVTFGSFFLLKVVIKKAILETK